MYIDTGVRKPRGCRDAGSKPDRMEPCHGCGGRGAVPIISVQTNFPLLCQVRPQKSKQTNNNKNRCFSEDTSNMTASSYSCFLATATSTAQQNTTSSPAEDDPQADLSGLRNRAVNALGQESYPPSSLLHPLCRHDLGCLALV